MKRITIYLQLSLCCFTSLSQIQLDSTMADTATIQSGLNTVWDMVYGSDDRIWYTERVGKISRVDPVTKQNKLLAWLPDVYENAAGMEETGLLGMALHPDFADTPWVFVVYNYLDGSAIKEKLVRLTYTGDTLLNPTVILDNITGGGNHDGSRLVITSDRKILMTTGDAGDQNNAQDLNTLEGKILRMNLDGTVPADNPLTGKLIWTLGSRNAQGLVLSPDGILYSSEHGPSSDDELNIISKGRNYGWPIVKGFCDSPAEVQFCLDSNVAEPILAWTPTIAPAGMDYYSENEIPEFKDALLLCTLKEQDLRVIRLSGSGDSVISKKIYLDNALGRIRDVCFAPNGDVFIGTSNRDGKAQNPFPLEGDDRIIRLRNADLSGILYRQTETPGIFPNPSSGIYYLSGSESLLLSVEIFNLYGVRIYYKSISGKETRIDLSGFPEGVYFAIFTNTPDRIPHKLIILK